MGDHQHRGDSEGSKAPSCRLLPVKPPPAFSRMSYERNDTQQNASESLSCCRGSRVGFFTLPRRVSLYDCPSFACLLSHGRTSGLPPGTHPQASCSFKHSRLSRGVNVSFHFSWVNNRKWVSWAKWYMFNFLRRCQSISRCCALPHAGSLWDPASPSTSRPTPGTARGVFSATLQGLGWGTVCLSFAFPE